MILWIGIITLLWKLWHVQVSFLSLGGMKNIRNFQHLLSCCLLVFHCWKWALQPVTSIHFFLYWKLFEDAKNDEAFIWQLFSGIFWASFTVIPFGCVQIHKYAIWAEGGCGNDSSALAQLQVWGWNTCKCSHSCSLVWLCPAGSEDSLARCSGAWAAWLTPFCQQWFYSVIWLHPSGLK